MDERIKELNQELTDAIINFTDYHAQMRTYRDYYKNSVFYKPKTGAAPKRDMKVNFLKVFADKNIHYTSPFPTIKVPVPGADPMERQFASIREKILYSVHQKSNSGLLQRRYASDGTIDSFAVNETIFDIEKRCVRLRRYDPTHCVWQLSNDNERRLIAFWAVYAITKEECQKRYGITPTNDMIGLTALKSNPRLRGIDGKEWFTMAIRWDHETRAAWVGDQFIEEPHDHMMGQIPIDIAIPFDEPNDDQRGAFYLEQLVPLQAELNHTVKQRANIAHRMANPVFWVRGMIGKQLDETKRNLRNQDGGMIGLKQQGDAGLLQVNDVNLLDRHIEGILDQMMRLSGFSAASFGESVGANTSGDALGMYFTPTQRLIEHQNVAWKAFWESINSKILMAYERFAKYNEVFTLDGYHPTGALMPIENDSSQLTYQQSGAFSIRFDKTVIAGNYNNVAVPKPITPKNEIEEKRWALDAVHRKVISRTTAYEHFNILSPEDELELLKQEQSEAMLNPEGISQILQGIPAETDPADAAVVPTDGA